MKTWNEFLENKKMDYTPEMKEAFVNRTKRHIELVQKYCNKIEKLDPERFKGLIERSEVHDASKFEEPEMTPYIFINWQYRCKDTGEKFDPPSTLKDDMNKATEHHVKSNRHHPEYFAKESVGLINREDRDKKPDKLVDATEMPDLDLGELVSDWLAMSEERGNKAKEWADKNVNIRWKFTDEQSRLIYSLLKAIEG